MNCDPRCRAMLEEQKRQKALKRMVCNRCGVLVPLSVMESEHSNQLQANMIGAEMDDSSHIGMTADEFENYVANNDIPKESVEKMTEERNNSDTIYPTKLPSFSVETQYGPVIIDIVGSADPIYTMPSVEGSYYFLIPAEQDQPIVEFGIMVENAATKSLDVALVFQGKHIGVFRIDSGATLSLTDYPETGDRLSLGSIHGNSLGENTGLLEVVISVVDTPFSRKNAQPADYSDELTQGSGRPDKKKKKDKKSKKTKKNLDESSDGKSESSELETAGEPVPENQSNSADFDHKIGYEATDAGVPLEILELAFRLVRIDSKLTQEQSAEPPAEPGVPIKKVTARPPLPKNIKM